jgi:hypothetical protein
MSPILTEIKNIDPDNKFINYIIKRIQVNNYRGIHVSQHNRYDLEYLKNIIQSIYDTVGSDVFEVPRGDYKHDFTDDDLKSKFKDYKNIVDNLKKNTDKGTYNSLKKNLFVDMNRAGLLLRYDKNMNVISGKKGVFYAKLSDTAIRFLNANIIEQYRIFTDCLDKLFEGFLSEFVDLLYSSPYKDDEISIYEFMFIFSDLSIDNDTKIVLLNEYRKLNQLKKDKLLDLIKKYANPDNFKGNKTNKRDFHNWKNETQQIFSLLGKTSYFQVIELNGCKYIRLNIGDYGIFSVETFKRSYKPKKEYFAYHNIEKIPDFELHHIIPISKARNKKEVELIDNVKNLIYISVNKHKELTRNKNIHIALDLTKDVVIFANPHYTKKDKITAKNKEDAYYSTDEKIINKLVEHNRKLLNMIYS